VRLRYVPATGVNSRIVPVRGVSVNGGKPSMAAYPSFSEGRGHWFESSRVHHYRSLIAKTALGSIDGRLQNI
jgi:hypothetical protein